VLTPGCARACACLAGRRDHNRLGFSLQLTTARQIGKFLADPLEGVTFTAENMTAAYGLLHLLART
jgi:hypothetical protein